MIIGKCDLCTMVAKCDNQVIVADFRNFVSRVALCSGKYNRDSAHECRYLIKIKDTQDEE